VAGYTRQSTADIIPTATVRAAPLNAEYNAIRDAFAASGGHKHDGTTAEGEYVPLISDLDNYNKVVIDSTNNRVGVFVEVSSSAVEQVRFQDGAIVPVTTNDIDLGTSSLKFKDLYIEGTSTIGTVDIDGGNIDGTIIGATTAAAADFTTMDASGNATVGGTFAVTGNTTVGGTLGVTGVTTLGTANITSVDLDSGAIDNTTIGATTAAAGTFTTLTANTSLTAATADINGGTLDGVTIGGTTSAAATVTDLTATGTSTLTTVDINGGAIDGTTIGASSAAAGSFTTVSTSGQATLATADINGGTIDGTTIGATTAAAITGTTVTATSFVGPVTGNVTGNLTGDVTGDLTGDVTGNITSSGSSSFNNVTIDGTLNMNAGTTATITNLTAPSSDLDAATKKYVDDEIAGLVDSAPGTLDTLNELAAALGDDPNFSTTITNSIATKLPLAGGTMTGAIAMGTSKITGLGDPTAAQDAMTKAYADATYLALSGGTMTGAIDMGSQKITTTYTPTNAADLTTKTYVDGILGSATAASASAAAAATSESNAATSETNAATSESNAAASATSAAASYDSFDDRYLGAKASAPTVDNDGDALVIGALYYNTTTNIMNVYGSSGWQSAGSAVNGTSDRVTYTATSGQTVFAATYDSGSVDVYLNGVKLLAGTDFTATNGTSITLTTGAAVNDIVDIVAYGTFVLADHYSKSQSDARYVEVAGDTMTGDLNITGTLTSDGADVSGGADSTGQIVLSQGNASSKVSRIIGTNQGGTNERGIDFNTYNYADYKRMNIKPNGDISFYEDTGTTAKFFWDASAESLGIGTTTPNSPLDIQASTSGTQIRLTYPSVRTWNAGVQSGGQFAIRDANAAADRIVINSSGNVGIGTSSPSEKLHVNSGGGNVPALFESTDTLSLITFKDNDTTQTIGVGAQDNAGVFYTAGTERMRIDSSGRVMIGTTTEGQVQAENLTISDSGNMGMTLRSTDGGETSIFFSDGTSGAAEYAGWFQYQHASDRMTFATNASEAMRIDSSGNLLVGTTDSTVYNNSGSGTGINLQNFGNIAVARDGNDCMVLNRLNSDGAIANFAKDGTTVGSIGSVASGANLYMSAASGVGLGIGGDNLYPVNASGASTDGSLDIGDSTARFKDLYLSGGVYLGGTGSANKLDDYEEGTFTYGISTTSSGGWTVRTGYTTGYYTKIGRTVHIHLRFESTTRNSPTGDIRFTGLPFSVAGNPTNGNGSGQVPILFRGNNRSTVAGHFIGLVQGSTTLSLFYQDTGSTTIGSVSSGTVTGNLEGTMSFTYVTS
jgi:hypothetical protein